MKINKVLLINPEIREGGFGEFRTFETGHPLGLAYLAAMLEKHGIQVRILENYILNKPHEYVIELLQDFGADLVGFTCTSLTYRTCASMAGLIRKHYPEKIMVVGGPHATLFPEQTLKGGDFDAVVLGEGEYILRDLVLSTSKSQWHDIKGLIFKKDGGFISTGRREPIANLDELPMPARHLLPMDKYHKTIELLDVSPVYSINSSRGCPFSCHFCSANIIWGARFRAFSPAYVIKEIQHLIANYGARGVYFREDCFTADPRRVIEICRLIKAMKINIQWACGGRLDLLSEDIVKEMVSAGCTTVWCGVESGSERVLKEIVDKRITKEKMAEVFALCKRHGLRVVASFVVGFPGETKREMLETLAFADKLDPYWACFTPYVCVPGSHIYDDVMKDGCYESIDHHGIPRVKTNDFDQQKLKWIALCICAIYLLVNPRRLFRYIFKYLKTGASA